MMKLKILAVISLLVMGIVIYLHSLVGPKNVSVPIELLNQDVTQSTISVTVCVPGWTKSVRPSSEYTTALKRTQLPPGSDLRAYEEDHLVPLELGGGPKNPENLRPQLRNGPAEVKDQEENRLHAEVCSGSMTLQDAQSIVYREWVGK